MMDKVEVKEICCFNCEQPLDTDKHVGLDNMHPWVDGTIFDSSGNYGSTHWDEEGPRYLQIVICNDCLKSKAGLAHVVEWRKQSVLMIRRVDFDTYHKEQNNLIKDD